MSVLYGLDPRALLDLDGPMFDALERVADQRTVAKYGPLWTIRDEYAAATLELLDGQLRQFIAVHLTKGRRPPPPIRVPRPDPEGGFAGPPVLSASAFAAEYGPPPAKEVSDG